MMSINTRLRSEPFRLFFPLGLALSWAAVGHWLLFGIGVIESYHSIFHAMVQVQGFLTCFAIGFLMTMLPRRTSTAPPAAATLVVCMVCPVGTTIAAWFEHWILAQAFWLVLAAVVGGFVLRRLDPRRAGRRAPNSFVWIPAALAFGVAGTVMTAVGAALGGGYWSWHEIGRSMVLQGMFLALVIGVGSFAVPLMTRGEAAADGGSSARDWWIRALHVFAMIALAASFPLENLISLRLGFALRGAVAIAVLLLVAEIHRPPERPGVIRWSIWLAVWCVPSGYLLATAMPGAWKGALHVTFIGGFAMLALSVSSQVILGHGGYERLKAGRPWPLVAMMIALGGAVVSRLLVELDPARLAGWIASASGLFLLATLFWGALLVPRLLRGPRAEEV